MFKVTITCCCDHDGCRGMIEVRVPVVVSRRIERMVTQTAFDINPIALAHELHERDWQIYENDIVRCPEHKRKL